MARRRRLITTADRYYIIIIIAGRTRGSESLDIDYTDDDATVINQPVSAYDRPTSHSHAWLLLCAQLDRRVESSRGEEEEVKKKRYVLCHSLHDKCAQFLMVFNGIWVVQQNISITVDYISMSGMRVNVVLVIFAPKRVVSII